MGRLSKFLAPGIEYDDLQWVTVHVRERDGELQALQQGYWMGMERGPWPKDAYRWVPVEDLYFAEPPGGGD